MSIIYNALKKVEDNNKEPKPPSSHKTKKLLAVLVIAIGSLGVIAYFVVSAKNFFSNPGSEIQAEHSRSGSSGSDRKYKAGRYVLEGIIYDGQIPLAIINGEVLKKGDSIGDYKVTDITDNSVQLLDTKDNTTSTLSF